MLKVNEELITEQQYLEALETVECFMAQGDNFTLFTKIGKLDFPVRGDHALLCNDMYTLIDVKNYI